MLSTLKATVQGGKIDWQEATENIVPSDRPIEVLVTILGNHPNGPSPEERGRLRVAALQKLAALNAFSGIDDPVQWQQETRQDRDLPGWKSKGKSCV
jgi:hypothetical protein